MESKELLIETYWHIPPARALEALSAEDAERRLPDAPHSIVEIVGHLEFWQDWFRKRCEGASAPLVESAAAGWPSMARGSWPEVQERFLSGLSRLAAFGSHDRPISPRIEFPPRAHYTIGDALVHVANHNAHHLGQIILLRQMMGRWPPPSGSFTW